MATLPNLATLEKGFTGAQRDAFAALNQIFTGYGLGSLAPAIAGFLKNGYSADTITLLLRDTPEYKQRFSANDARVKAGLPALTPAEYLATENSYRQIMRAAGLPPGFYDQAQDFHDFIAKDVSPQELQQRVTDASTFVDNATPQQKALFSQWYTKGDMIAYALDPEKAEPLVGKQFTAAKIGGEATTHGLPIGQDMAMQLAQHGVTADQASQGFGVIQTNLPNDQKLAAISGQSLSAYDEMKEAFFNDGSVTLQRDKLASQERARFGGSSAIGTESLSTPTAGQI